MAATVMTIRDSLTQTHPPPDPWRSHGCDLPYCHLHPTPDLSKVFLSCRIQFQPHPKGLLDRRKHLCEVTEVRKRWETILRGVLHRHGARRWGEPGDTVEEFVWQMQSRKQGYLSPSQAVSHERTEEGWPCASHKPHRATEHLKRG